MTLVYRYHPVGVETSGTYWAGNTLKINGALCKQVYIKSATTTTNFDVNIKDKYDITIRKYKNITGELNNTDSFIVEGILTIEIENADADENFTVMLMFDDS